MISCRAIRLTSSRKKITKPLLESQHRPCEYSVEVRLACGRCREKGRPAIIVLEDLPDILRDSVQQMGWTKGKETVEYGEVELSMQLAASFRREDERKGAGSVEVEHKQYKYRPVHIRLVRGRASASPCTLFLSPSRPPSNLLHPPFQPCRIL